MVRLADLDYETLRTCRPGPAREELMAVVRELALRSLAWFMRYRFLAERRRLVWQPYLDVVCETMEAVTLRQIRRAVLNLPPRALKSETITQSWQAWMIAREDSPRSSLVSASYAAELAERDSFKTRDIMRSEWYRELCPTPVEFKRDTQANWETVAGAARSSAGSDGPITGKGGDHLVGDDLLKPMDANSEVVREKVNSWFGEVFRSRLNDPATGTITITAQRLHERDICGYLKLMEANPDADQWHHVNLPLIAESRTTYTFGRGQTWTRERGDCLNAERWPEREVRALKAMLGPNFWGQYQQRPTKQEGGMLRPTSLHRANAPATALVKRWGLRIHLYIDLATKEKQTVKDDPDFSVIVALARDQLDRVWILDVWHERVAMDATAAALLAMMERWQTRLVAGEKIGLQYAFKSVLALTCKVRRVPLPHLRDIPISGQGDKVQKAGAFAGLLGLGLIGVPAGAPWMPDLEAEMRTFPLGQHDDQVDAISLGCADLQSIPAGEAPPSHPRLERGQIDGRMLELAAKRARAIGKEEEADDDW